MCTYGVIGITLSEIQKGEKLLCFLTILTVLTDVTLRLMPSIIKGSKSMTGAFSTREAKLHSFSVLCRPNAAGMNHSLVFHIRVEKPYDDGVERDNRKASGSK